MSCECANDEFHLDQAETPWLVGYKHYLEDEGAEFMACMAVTEEEACRKVEDIRPYVFVLGALPSDEQTLSEYQQLQKAA